VSMGDGISARIVRISGGLCWADPEGSGSGDELVQCVARGNVKKRAGGVMVGDYVVVRRVDDGATGIVEQVLPRRNQLVRPAVANCDQAVVVSAVSEPAPNVALIERILIQVLREGLKACVVLTKCDTAPPGDYAHLVQMYRQAGFTTIVTSARTGQGVPEVREALRGLTSVFAGPSGAGKSALLNAVHPGYGLVEGDVSQRIGRGKHTTREVRLLRLHDGGYVADTPGFSILDIDTMDLPELAAAYPDFAAYAGQCRFTGCLHQAEPDCAVKRAVEEGAVCRARYEHYIVLLEELRQARRDMYR
jgi:ribosome biogenesis GTPase